MDDVESSEEEEEEDEKVGEPFWKGVVKAVVLNHHKTLPAYEKYLRGGTGGLLAVLISP